MTSNKELVEKIARGLCEQQGADPEEPCGAHEDMQPMWEYYIDEAQVALTAIKEAGYRVTPDLCPNMQKLQTMFTEKELEDARERLKEDNQTVAAILHLKEKGYAVVPAEPTKMQITRAKYTVQDMKTWILKPSDEGALSQVYKVMIKAGDV